MVCPPLANRSKNWAADSIPTQYRRGVDGPRTTEEGGTTVAQRSQILFIDLVTFRTNPHNALRIEARSYSIFSATTQNSAEVARHAFRPEAISPSGSSYRSGRCF